MYLGGCSRPRSHKPAHRGQARARSRPLWDVLSASVPLSADPVDLAMDRAGITNEAAKVGYEVMKALASNELDCGWSVVVDAVNPFRYFRDAYFDVAAAHEAAVAVIVRCARTSTFTSVGSPNARRVRRTLTWRASSRRSPTATSTISTTCSGPLAARQGVGAPAGVSGCQLRRAVAPREQSPAGSSTSSRSQKAVARTGEADLCACVELDTSAETFVPPTILRRSRCVVNAAW
jgi:hypothetical protein